jgi:hypothetical protein
MMMNNTKLLTFVAILLILLSFGRWVRAQTTPPITVETMDEIRLLYTIKCDWTGWFYQDTVYIGVDPTDDHIAVGGCEEDKINIWDLSALQIINDIEVYWGSRRNIYFSADGASLIDSLFTTVYNIETGLQTQRFEESCEHSESSPRYLAVCDEASGEIQIWDSQSNQLFASFDVDIYGIRSLEFSQNSANFFAFDLGERNLQIWPLDGSSAPVYSLHGVRNVVFSPDLSQAAVDYDERVEIIDTETLENIGTLTQLPPHRYLLDFSLDNNTLALRVYGEGGRAVLEVWNIQSVNQISTFPEFYDVNLLTDTLLYFLEDGPMVIGYNFPDTPRLELWTMEQPQLAQTLQIENGFGPRGSSDGIYILGLTGNQASLIVAVDEYILIYGIPNEQRPAFGTILGYVFPSSVNVRDEPDLNSPISGIVEEGRVLVAGRDQTGEFVYLPAVDGWIRAETIDLGDIPLMELPIRE